MPDDAHEPSGEPRPRREPPARSRPAPPAGDWAVADSPGGDQPAGGTLPGPRGVGPWFLSEDGRFALYHGDCLALLPLFAEESFDLIFADPPYFLSNDGITCHAGKMVSVNKGKWDRSRGFAGNYDFTRSWLAACRRVLRPDGTIWVSGTSHIIHIVGCCLDELGYRILNDITWVKPNPPPNLSCRYFTHATETVIWAGRDRRTRHRFNYPLMKRLNSGKQMTSVWTIEAPRREEKVFGKHPTQKPLALLERIIAAASDEGDCVLDPFCGSGTTGIAAARMNRPSVGVELETEYLEIGTARFEGVPQADRPERILALLRAHAAGERAPSDLARRMGLTERQVHYYRQAAALVGLLSRATGAWELTERGKEVGNAPPGQGEFLVAGRMLQVPIVAHALRVARGYRTVETKRTALAAMIGRCTALGLSTCQRRAQTLLCWLEWAESRVGPHAGRLQGLVDPSLHEPQGAPVAQQLQLLADLRAHVPVARM